MRFDPLQLDWMEGYALGHGLNFLDVIRLAVSRLIENELSYAGGAL